MSALLRRKRLEDGTFGELEKVFDGETQAETIERMEEENASLSFAMLEKDLRLDGVEAVTAEILLQLLLAEVPAE